MVLFVWVCFTYFMHYHTFLMACLLMTPKWLFVFVWFTLLIIFSEKTLLNLGWGAWSKSSKWSKSRGGYKKKLKIPPYSWTPSISLALFSSFFEKISIFNFSNQAVCLIQIWSTRKYPLPPPLPQRVLFL